MSDGDEHDVVRDSAITFPRILSRLKREGSLLLVVGGVPEEAYVHTCRRLAGDIGEATRRRVFVLADSAEFGVTGRLGAHARDVADEHVRLVTYASPSRGATDRPGNGAVADHRVVDGRLDDLAVAIDDAISAFRSEADEVAPGEVRLCLDSALALLADHDREQVFRFLYVLRGRLREVRGMGHVHLPVERDADAARLLASLADIVVELRVRDGRPQERWHLREGELSSEWLAL